MELMAHEVLRKIISPKREEIFSLIVDETRDIQGKEQVSICIRTVNDQLEAEEDFVGLYAVESTTAANLAAVIRDVITRLGLKMELMRGQCYDGAANMSGVFGGTRFH